MVLEPSISKTSATGAGLDNKSSAKLVRLGVTGLVLVTGPDWSFHIRPTDVVSRS
jgi:hypothetical protein